uniref:DUF1499 domain-containing protein n=1 Tax=Rhizochromulina marina TaxID=1034831 RepID=A0A7S2RUZ7_9STRA|mmetsp:Transcript_21434/g.62441  ORF Transcript_21434/g.62441 Transcript_21434/m.62441 type:complete len:319 (+) Transcript_21434:79-1035(+)
MPVVSWLRAAGLAVVLLAALALPMSAALKLCGKGGCKARRKFCLKPRLNPAVAVAPVVAPVAGYYGVMLAPIYGKGLLPGTGGKLDFEALKPRMSPNEYLVAPEEAVPNFVDEAKRGVAKVYPVSRTELREAFFRAVNKQYAIQLYAQPTLRDEALDQYVFVHRTLYFRFPDVLNVRFVDCEGGVSVVLHSGSVYGYDDLGKNKARVETWLEALDEELSMLPKSADTAGASLVEGVEEPEALVVEAEEEEAEEMPAEAEVVKEEEEAPEEDVEEEEEEQEPAGSSSPASGTSSDPEEEKDTDTTPEAEEEKKEETESD